LLVFTFALDALLPSSGWVYLPGTCPTVVCDESVWGNLKHVLLSAIALGGGRSAILTRLLRASMPEVIRMEYITAARPKGLVEEARHQQTCAEERPDPHGDDNGA
jgi:ABC-type dipeptide/oligopeptide/nickel transport system permease component